MTYIEEHIDDLEKEHQETKRILYFLLSKIQKHPEPHSEFCTNYEREIVKKYGYTTGSCRCDSELINDRLNLKRLPILDEEEIEQLKKEYKQSQKLERSKKKAKRSVSSSPKSGKVNRNTVKKAVRRVKKK